MRISELKSPYKELAELRRNNGDWIESLYSAFTWQCTPEGSVFWCDVIHGKYPPIPDESLKELQFEWVIGKEYEFSDGYNTAWRKRKLIAVLPDNLPKRFIVQIEDGVNRWASYDQIRHIEPQIKEVTIEENAEKFGVSVESIKIKK